MNIMLDEGAFKPEFAHKTDAGADLRSPTCITLPARGSAIIDTGVHIEIPQGYVGILKSKSGLNIKHNIIGTGTIDSGFSGSIKVNGKEMNITGNNTNHIIAWGGGFNINKGETKNENCLL